MPSDVNDDQLEILKGILTEVQDLNMQLARTDERSRNNKDQVEDLRENRIVPLESQAEQNDNRSRRNSLVLGAAVTLTTILLGAGVTYVFTLL